MTDFIRYPKIYRLGHKENENIFSNGKIYVEEKMDGANVRWKCEGSIIRYGSRRRELTEVDDVGQFEKFREWVLGFNSEELKEGYEYFGEYMIPHTIRYDWDRVPIVLGFDIYDLERGHFLSYDEKVKEFERIGVPVVPLVDERDVSEIDDKYLEHIIPESKYYNGQAEGVVFKNYDLQIFAKLVAENFKERNEKVFGGSKKKAVKEGDNEKYLLEKYVPVRRVEKVIQSLVDEGHELDMKLMEILPRRVLDDVIEEEGIEIFRETITIDMRRFRKLISKRCVNVLQRMIAQRAVIGR